MPLAGKPSGPERLGDSGQLHLTSRSPVGILPFIQKGYFYACTVTGHAPRGRHCRTSSQPTIQTQQELARHDEKPAPRFRLHVRKAITRTRNWHTSPSESWPLPAFQEIALGGGRLFMMGWQCPGCGRCYSPFTASCGVCQPRTVSTSNSTISLLVDRCPSCCGERSASAQTGCPLGWHFGIVLSTTGLASSSSFTTRSLPTS